MISQVFRRHGRRHPNVDLTDSAAPTLALLENTWSWRQRLVEEFTFHDAEHLRVTSSYQIELPPAFIQRFSLADAESANVLLPITTRRKETLVNFDVQVGHTGSGSLLPRAAIADVERLYLQELKETSAVKDSKLSGLTPPLLTAICGFTPATWREFQIAYAYNADIALREYISQGLNLNVSMSNLVAWRAQAQSAGDMLIEALEEPPNKESASENVLLALPGMDPPPATEGEVSEVVYGYANSVADAYAEGDTGFDILSVLAEYGRRWEMIIEAQIPTYRPTLVRLGEDRALNLSREQTTVQRIALGDAASVHFEARVTDHHVQLKKEFDLRDLWGDPLGVPTIESAAIQRESLSLYTSVVDRPYYVEITLGVEQAPYIKWITPGAVALTVASLVGVLLVNGPSIADRLALLVLPTTFAGSFLLVREETPLAAVVQETWRRVLGMTLGFMWLSAFVRLILDASLVPEFILRVEQLLDIIGEGGRNG